MKVELDRIPPSQQYKILSSAIVPRPIALVTTRSRDGRNNAAPFSLFNFMGEDPPVVVLGLEDKRTGGLKDTTINIVETGQFVVHMVDRDLAEAMNICSIDFPPNICEAESAGLTLVACDRIAPLRIAEAPIAFECEKIALIQVGARRNIALGRATVAHLRDGLFDPQTFYVDVEKYQPIGRLFGTLYTHTAERFTLPGHTYAQWSGASALNGQEIDAESGRAIPPK
jgi:flavin reductase (DIM6/NTAB) family NADH-FMN oxidoreductase RutF